MIALPSHPVRALIAPALLLAGLTVLTVAACVPADPMGRTIGVRANGSSYEIYAPLCPGETVSSVRVYRLVGDAGKLAWSGKRPSAPMSRRGTVYLDDRSRYAQLRGEVPRAKDVTVELVVTTNRTDLATDFAMGEIPESSPRGVWTGDGPALSSVAGIQRTRHNCPG